MHHKKLKHHDATNTVPVVSMDFAFAKRSEQQGTSPVLVLRDHMTRVTFAHALPGKSTQNEPYSAYTVNAVIQDIKMLDRKHVILKSDQEVAMTALQERVKALRSGNDEQTFLENSPVAESQSNGVVEKAIQEVENMASTLMSALEERLLQSVPWDSPLGSWLIEYSAVLINLYREGKDGRTPMERLRGDKHGRPIAEFGENVLYKPLGDAPAFPEARFLYGTWLGIDLRTGEILVGTTSGVVRARTIKRRPEPERWSAEQALGVRGVPWQPTPGIDSDRLPTAVRRPPMAGDPDAPVPPCTEPGQIARRAKLTKEDFEKYGFTEGCIGCRHTERHGKTHYGHNELCRRRIERELMKDEPGRQRVEEGYARMADAAMRISERVERAQVDQPVADEAVDEQPPKKRPRDGSTVGLPPSTDEAGRRGSEMTDDAPGASPSRNPSVPRTFEISTPTPRGQKRESDGNDDDRVGEREEVYEGEAASGSADQASNVAQPSRPPASSSSMPVDHLSKHLRHEAMAMGSLSAEGRHRDMSVVRKKLGCKNDVSEVYSPPRIVTVAEAAGLRGGFSLDLTAPDCNGYVWDFSERDCRERARRLMREQKPYLLIGSPPCTAWSNLQNLNRCRPGGSEKVDEQQRRAKVHLLFCTSLYLEQMAAGRYFLHEHPQSATSWKENCMVDLASNPMVMETVIDQCAYGLKSKDKEGEAPAKKPTKFYTNSVAIGQELRQRCPGCERHVQLVEGRAAAAQQYPRELCRAVTRGIIQQARMDSADMYSIVCDDLADGLYDVNHINTSEVSHIEHEPEDWKSYWDDASGDVLDTQLTKAARREEIKGIHDMRVYRKVPIKMCLDETGKRPIGTRWVDTNKGDKSKPNVRSRLVAQELNRFKQPELFAATPPVEYIRYLISRCASSQWSSKPSRIMINDVKKAYFYAPATRRVFVALPDEDRLPGEEGLCALLLKSLYGTRDAAYNWTEAYTKALIDLGFTKGESSPCNFYHKTRNICTVVHGDDFFSEGAAEELKWLNAGLSRAFQIKTEVLGPDGKNGEQLEIRFLNRIVQWRPEGITWEADPRHAELIIQQLELEDCAPVVTPGVRHETKKEKVEQEMSFVESFEMSGVEQLESVECAMAYVLGRADSRTACCSVNEMCSGEDCREPSPSRAHKLQDKCPFQKNRIRMPQVANSCITAVPEGAVSDMLGFPMDLAPEKGPRHSHPQDLQGRAPRANYAPCRESCVTRVGRSTTLAASRSHIREQAALTCQSKAGAEGASSDAGLPES